MQVAMVILHFFNQKLTEQCLESVRRLKTRDFNLQVIIVNNHPQEDLKNLEKRFSRFLFLKTGKNLGFTGGNNVGIRQALENKADWIFLVNNDTILDKDLIVQLIKVGESDEKIGVLGPKIYFAPGFEFHKERYKPNEQGKVIWFGGGVIDWENILASHRGVDEVDKGQYDQVEETDFVSGCAMFVKKEVFEKIGLLDEKCFLYWEDLDFCQRAQKAGFKVIYVPKAKLWHANAGSSQVGGPLQDYFISRNRMLFGMRYAPWRSKLALVKESLKIMIKGRQWQKRGVKDFYLGRFGKGSYPFER